jgi:hypothetical protein
MLNHTDRRIDDNHISSPLASSRPDRSHATAACIMEGKRDDYKKMAPQWIGGIDWFWNR